MRIIYFSLIACSLMAVGCGSSNTAKNPAISDSTAAIHTTVAKEPAKSKLNEEGTKMVLGVVSDYYVLKNAMVATKATDAAAAATKLATSAASLQDYLLKDSSGMAALKPYTDTIITQSKLAATLTDPTCEKQRAAFGPISSALYTVLKKVELKNAGIYHEFCPMAFNDKGATWLSEESEIKNPYFGKKMMECGEVTDSL